VRKILAILALLCFVGLAAWFAVGPTSTSTIAAQWLLLALASIAVALWLWIELKPPASNLGDHVQAFSAIFTIVAIFIAAGIYLLEGRDKVRLSFSLETSVIRVTGAGRQNEVLLMIRVPVENHGERSVVIQCLGVDVQRPDPEHPGMRRSRDSPEEMFLIRNDSPPIDFDSRITDACIGGTVNRLRRRGRIADRASVRPIYMWQPMTLKPGETDDVHFEIPIRCENPFVRILVKMRVNPDDIEGYETKTIVPLTDTCSGAAVTRGGVSTPTVGTGDEPASASAPAPAPGT
jgi:hypothetical protein